ncbi:zinc ribbon domain-containing protein [Elusimicrobiota bacterium]
MASLLLLQEQDRRVDELKRGLDKIPPRIEAIKAEIENEQARLNELHEKAKRVQVERKEKESGLAQNEEAIRKHQGELNQIKTNEAFKALLKEIDGEKAAVGELETEILTLMDEGDALLKEEQALKGELKEFEADKNQEVQSLEDRQGGLENDFKAATAKRAELAGAIPEELGSLYEATRARRNGVGLAQVKQGDICAECNMKLTPQSLINIKKGTRVELCGSCQRILYDPALVSADQA